MYQDSESYSTPFIEQRCLAVMGMLAEKMYYNQYEKTLLEVHLEMFTNLWLEEYGNHIPIPPT